MTEQETRSVLDAFCRAAEKETGDFWEILQMENGSLAVVWEYRAAREKLARPEATAEEKALTITGEIVCESSKGVSGLADRLVSLYNWKSLYFTTPPFPLPFLEDCGSVEEMAVRLAAYAP